MILTSLICGAAIIAGIGIIAAFWNDLISFLKKALQKVQQLVEGIVYGCKVFVKKLQEGVKEISRHYSKVDQHWQETTGKPYSRAATSSICDAACNWRHWHRGIRRPTLWWAP